MSNYFILAMSLTASLRKKEINCVHLCAVFLQINYTCKHTSFFVSYFIMDIDISAEKILEEAMKMPARERAVIAEKLISTLDEEIDTDVEIIWQKEVQQRADQIK
ncbi:MAG: addiction module protein [Spirochaetia bacterium]|nr:addiction module protein [Spirochaetia bacterium]